MRIAYQSCCSRGNWQIWVMGETGAGKVNVSKSTFADTQPAFSPDGQRIAFVRSGQIWVMNADGTAKTRLTAPSGYTDDEPSWSPDGQKIAFQRCCYPIPGWPPEISQIFTVDAAGQNARNVSGTLGSTSDFHPDWSPDGSKIVFARCVCLTTNDEIYVLAADGSGQTARTPTTRGGHRTGRRSSSTWAHPGSGRSPPRVVLLPRLPTASSPPGNRFREPTRSWSHAARGRLCKSSKGLYWAC
jgi:TolB protein